MTTDVVGVEQRAAETGPPDSPVLDTFQSSGRLAPLPLTVEETGLSLHFLADLVCKHLYDGGVLSVRELASRLGLPGPVVEKVVSFLRDEARVELRPLKGESGLRFSLTDKGGISAREALLRSGYIGPAPVPLETYARIAEAQSIHSVGITRPAIHEHFAGVVINGNLLDQLGAALNSGRAIFVYGPAGTGKTYITQRLTPLFDDACLIPHAIAVGESVVQVFDPVVHKVLDADRSGPVLLFDDGFDARFHLCRRPVVISGGELTLDLLDIRFDAGSRQYEAPLQLKANNGIFIIDDMGRQQVSPMEIFNRWIVPLEDRKDYLALDSGRHFQVPFDEVLIFSSNINPLELADEAFLRRIGYKIRFDTPTESEYEAIWKQECEKNGVAFNDGMFRYLVEDLHGDRDIPMLPCHPRDLLGIAMDRSVFVQEPAQLDPEHIQWAWDNYFVRL